MKTMLEREIITLNRILPLNVCQIIQGHINRDLQYMQQLRWRWRRTKQGNWIISIV